MAQAYVTFIEQPVSGRKTGVWEVRSVSRDITLGWIRWHGAWRQYVFAPESETIWSTGCLADVEEFIRGRMALRRVA